MDPEQVTLDTREAQQSYRRPQYGASLFEVMHRRYASVTERAILEADTAVVASQQRLVEQKAALCLAELNARTAVALASAKAEEAQAEVEFARHLRSLAPADARTELSAEIETERRRALRSAYQTIRQRGIADRLLPPVTEPSREATAKVEVDVSEEEIAREAMQGVVTLGGLPAAERSGQYKNWLAELESRLPQFAADEIAARTRTMLAVIRIAP